jgi:hypothetical protein
MASIQKELESYGLRLVERVGVMEVFVIKKK